MNVAIFNWRDLAHPRAGGAEFYSASVAQVLHQAGHTVTWFASRFPNSTATDRTDYCRILRAGNQITVRAHAAAWLWSHPEVDLIIDEVNTLPFLSPLLRPNDTVLLIHQLAREVWFLERPGFLGAIGYASEALSLRIYRDNPIVTISRRLWALLCEIVTFGLSR